ncbi:hypothetical protein D0863_00685 [Hortaea werneckii]|uniref:Involucrin repeat protein n=1 Tax=Hortaea werneckii TaxID=91943 RepID=A0A3M7EPF1_HORWE|nr:hypothetical protein D0863_00685 [Hortaea werneckii]
MWKAAFTGRSDSGKSGRDSGDRRKKSSGRSGDSVTSAPAAGSSRRDRDRDGRDDEREHRRRKSSKGGYGDDETASRTGSSIYATAPTSRAGTSNGPPALTESTLRMLNDEDGWEDESVAGKSEKRSRRSGEDGLRRKKSSRSEKRSRSRSRSRDRQERREQRRREREGAGGYAGDREKDRSSAGKARDRDGERGIPAMGSFEQFPGQFAGGPAFEYGNGAVASGQNDYYMSGGLPTADAAHQFPDQNPSTYTRPQMGPNRADSYGHAADYYLDQGQSVHEQPGVRSRTPNMLSNPDTHLVAASSEANPVQDTGNGTAADFYGGKVSPVPFTAEPDTIGPSSKPSKPGKTSSGSSSKPSKLGKMSAAAAGAAGMLPSDPKKKFNRSVTDPSAAASTEDLYTSSVQGDRTPPRGASARGDADSFYGTMAGQTAPSGTRRGEADSFYAPGRPLPAQATSGDTYYSHPSQQSPRPGTNLQGSSGKSNANLAGYATTAAGAAAAGYAAYDIKNRYDEKRADNRMESQSFYGTTQTPQRPGYATSAAGMSSAQLPPRPGYLASPGRGGGMMGPHMHHHHEHRGPISRFKDGLLNLISSPEDVAKMEDYTEYIGVCKYCFDPRSTSFMAPRKHHYDPRRRRSNDALRRKGSGDSLKQRVDKESRYYAQTDSKWRRSSSFDKSDMLAAGLGAAGLAAGANAFFNDKKDFDDVYSVKSGHRASSAARRRSRSSSREQRRRGEYGTIGGKEPRANWVTVRTKDGRIEKRRVHHTSRSRSRSKSQNRRSSCFGGVAAGAALGAAGAAAMHHRRGSSPNGAFVRPHQSRSRSSSSSSGSRSPGLGEIFGFTERKPRRGRRSPASSRRSSNAEGGGFFGGFFSPGRSNERKPSKGSRGHKKAKSSKGFFNFSNGSGSSSDPDMAFGGSEVFQSKESLPLRRKGSGRRVRRKSSDKHIAATVAGIGATAAALSAASKGNRVSKRGSRPELGQKRRSKRVGVVDSETEDDWEDELPSDADDTSSVDDGLAFGGSTLSHRQSMDSVSSGDGLNAWGWRWGGKDKKRDRRVSQDAKLPPGHPDSFSVGQIGAGVAAGAAAAGVGNMMKDDTGRPLPTANTKRTPSVSSSGQNQQPMQYVDPRPVSEAGSKISSMPGGWDLDEPVVSRPGPGPIQQPKPVAPVSPAFVRDEDMTRERPTPRRTASSPVRSSFGLSDAAAIGAGALAAGSIIAGSSSGRKSKDQVGNVRFGLTEEQQRKEDRQERRQSGKDDEDRRRADRTRALKEEAERFAKEEDARKREEEVGRKREEENRRAAEIRGERERIEAERREEERKLQMRREQEDAYHQEQARFAEDARRQEESNRQREAQAAEEAAKARREAEIRDDLEREQASRRSAPSSREGSRSRKGSKSSSAPWGQVAAGAAAAATVGAVVAGSKHQKQREKDADGERERGQYPEGEALYHPIQDDKSSYASRQIKPNDESSGSPMMDDDLYDRDFFSRKRGNSRQARSDDVDRETADQVVAEMDDYYQAPAPSQAEFFAPKDILSQPSGGKTKVADAHDDNQVRSWHATESDDPSTFPQGTASGKSKHAPYGVPALNVIAPTPPGSVTSSVKGKGSMPSSPLAQAQDVEDVPEPAGRRRSRSISWGENKTHSYDPPTPDSYQEREAYIREHDLPQEAHAKPEGNVDEVVVEPENGERRAYGEKDLPRKGETPPLYQKPFAESVSDFTALPVDSPGTEGMPAVRGYVEGETDEPTPAFEKPSHMPGAFDDDVYGETMSMAQEAGRARQEAEIADTPKAVEEPAWEPPLSKKEKKKREKAAKKSAFDTNEEPSTPTAGAAEVELPPSEPTETPRDEPGATVQEDINDYFPATLSKKDKKKREKALARGEPDPFAPDVGQSREAEASSEPQAVESPAPEPEQEPAFEMPKLSKKDQKKREKALARGEPDPFAPSSAEETKEVDAPTETPPAESYVAEPQPEAEVQTEPEIEMPKLSKKDQKKRERALARGEPDPFAPSVPSAANEEETQPEEQSFDAPAAEADPEAEFEAPKLSKKEQKKRDKEAQKQGFADAAAMAAAGVAGGAAIAGIASTDEQPEDGSVSTSSSKKGKKGKKQAREESFSDAWDAEQAPETRDAPAAEASDPFKDEPVTAPQEADPFAEFSDTKKSKKKKKRDSGRFNEPAASSPLRSEWNYNDYIGEQSTGGAEKTTTAEPESYVNGDGQPSTEFPSQDAEYGSQRGAADSSRQKSPERRSRSVASEPVEDRRKASRSKARSDFGYADDPDYFDDSRSVAASEPADVSFASERAAKRRSRREDDDNVSVTSSRSRRDRDASPPVEKKKKGGLFSLFSRKSTDSVPLNRTSSRDSRNDDEEDAERKHRRRKHREGSVNGEDDDARSTTSESRRRHRSSRDEDSRERRRSSKYDDVLESRSEPGGRARSRHYDDEDHRSPVSESGHRHHRRRRTDEDRDSKDQSFLGSRVEHLPPLPDSQPESSAPAQASTEQDIGTPASAGAVDSAPDNGVKSAPDVALQDPEGSPQDEDTKTVIEPSPLPDSQSREVQRDQDMAVDDLPALPSSRPESPTSLMEIMSRQTPPGRPKSSTAVPLRFPFGQQSKERSASFGGTTPASPTTPTSKQKKPRPSSTEIRPLYLVERNRPTPEVEETLPSLPSSKPSSRASSVQGSDEWHSAAEDFSPERNRSLTIDTDHANAYNPDEDYLDSQQTTPKAVEFPQDTEPRSERQEPQFYTWADFEQDERLHSGAPEPQTSDPPALGEPFQEASTGVDEKTLSSSEKLAPQDPERSEQDQHGGAAEAVAGAAVLGGAAALGYHALKEDKFEDAPSGHEGEQAPERKDTFQMPEGNEASAASNLDNNELEAGTEAPPQEQASSSKKKKKGKKGKKGAAEDAPNEAEAEAAQVAPSTGVPEAVETEPRKDADTTGVDNTQPTAPDPSPEQQDQAAQFETPRSVEDPEALQRSPEKEDQSFNAAEQLGQHEPPADAETEGAVFEPKLNRKQAKKAKKKQQQQAWEPEGPEQQPEGESQQPATDVKDERQIDDQPATEVKDEQQTDDQPVPSGETPVNEAKVPEEPQEDAPSAQAEDTSSSKSKKKSKKDKKKAKRQEAEEDFAAPNEEPSEPPAALEDPPAEDDRSAPLFGDAAHVEVASAAPEDTMQSVHPEQPIPSQENVDANDTPKNDAPGDPAAEDVQTSRDAEGVLAPTTDQIPEDDQEPIIHAPDHAQHDDGPTMEKTEPENPPEAASAIPEDEFPSSSKKSKKNKKAKKAAELAAAAAGLLAGENNQTEHEAAGQEQVRAAEPEPEPEPAQPADENNGAISAPAFEDTAPPAEADPIEQVAGTEATSAEGNTLDDEPAASSKKKGKKAKKSKMVGAWPGEESTESSQAHTPDEEKVSTLPAAEETQAPDAAITEESKPAQEPQAEDAESFWSEPTTKKKGKKGKKSKQQPDVSLADDAIQTDAGEKAASEEPANPVEPADFGDVSREQPTFERAEPEENSGEQPNIESAGQTEGQPPPEAQQLTENQDMEEEWPTSSSSKKKAKKAKKAKKSAAELPEEPSSVSAEPTPPQDDSVENQTPGEIKGEEAPQGLDAGPAGEALDQQPADKKEGVETETRLVEESKERPLDLQDPTAHGQAAENERDFTSEQEPPTSGLAAESARLDESSQEQPPPTAVHTGESSPAPQLSGEEASRGENVPDDDVAKSNDQPDHADQATEELQPSKKKSKKGKKAKAASPEEIQASEQVGATEPAELAEPQEAPAETQDQQNLDAAVGPTEADASTEWAEPTSSSKKKKKGKKGKKDAQDDGQASEEPPATIPEVTEDTQLEPQAEAQAEVQPEPETPENDQEQQRDAPIKGEVVQDSTRDGGLPASETPTPVGTEAAAGDEWAELSGAKKKGKKGKKAKSFALDDDETGSPAIGQVEDISANETPATQEANAEAEWSEQPTGKKKKKGKKSKQAEAAVSDIPQDEQELKPVEDQREARFDANPDATALETFTQGEPSGATTAESDNAKGAEFQQEMIEPGVTQQNGDAPVDQEHASASKDTDQNLKEVSDEQKPAEEVPTNDQPAEEGWPSFQVPSKKKKGKKGKKAALEDDVPSALAEPLEDGGKADQAADPWEGAQVNEGSMDPLTTANAVPAGDEPTAGAEKEDQDKPSSDHRAEESHPFSTSPAGSQQHDREPNELDQAQTAEITEPEHVSDPHAQTSEKAEQPSDAVQQDDQHFKGEPQPEEDLQDFSSKSKKKKAKKSKKAALEAEAPAATPPEDNEAVNFSQDAAVDESARDHDVAPLKSDEPIIATDASAEERETLPSQLEDQQTDQGKEYQPSGNEERPEPSVGDASGQQDALSEPHQSLQDPQASKDLIDDVPEGPQAQDADPENIWSEPQSTKKGKKEKKSKKQKAAPDATDKPAEEDAPKSILPKEEEVSNNEAGPAEHTPHGESFEAQQPREPDAEDFWAETPSSKKSKKAKKAKKEAAVPEGTEAASGEHAPPSDIPHDDKEGTIPEVEPENLETRDTQAAEATEANEATTEDIWSMPQNGKSSKKAKKSKKGTVADFAEVADDASDSQQKNGALMEPAPVESKAPVNEHGNEAMPQDEAVSEAKNETADDVWAEPQTGKKGKKAKKAKKQAALAQSEPDPMVEQVDPLQSADQETLTGAQKNEPSIDVPPLEEVSNEAPQEEPSQDKEAENVADEAAPAERDGTVHQEMEADKQTTTTSFPSAGDVPVAENLAGGELRSEDQDGAVNDQEPESTAVAQDEAPRDTTEHSREPTMEEGFATTKKSKKDKKKAKKAQEAAAAHFLDNGEATDQQQESRFDKAGENAAGRDADVSGTLPTTEEANKDMLVPDAAQTGHDDTNVGENVESIVEHMDTEHGRRASQPEIANDLQAEKEDTTPSQVDREMVGTERTANDDFAGSKVKRSKKEKRKAKKSGNAPDVEEPPESSGFREDTSMASNQANPEEGPDAEPDNSARDIPNYDPAVGEDVPMADNQPAEGENSIETNFQHDASNEAKEGDPEPSSTKKSKKDKRKAKKSGVPAFVDEDSQDAPPDAQLGQEQDKFAEEQRWSSPDQETAATAVEDQAEVHESSTMPAQETQVERDEQPFVDQAGQDGSNDAVNDPGDQPTLSTKKAKKKERRKAKKADLETPAKDEPDRLPDRDDGIPQHDTAQDQAPPPEDGLPRDGGSLEGEVAASPDVQLQQSSGDVQPQAEAHLEKEQAEQADESDFTRGQESQNIPLAAQDEWPATPSKQTKKEMRKAKKAGKAMADTDTNEPSQVERLDNDEDAQPTVTPATDDMLVETNKGLDEGIGTDTRDQAPPDDNPSKETDLFARPTPSSDLVATPAHEDPQESQSLSQGNRSPSRDIDFAATLAAGLADSGFDPDLVVKDPNYHRRASPPATMPEADPGEVSAATTTKRGKKAEKEKAGEESTGETTPATNMVTEAATNDREGPNGASGEDLDAAIAQSLQTAGFDPSMLSRASPSNDNSTFNEVGEDPSFSFTTSNKKKKKKGRQTAPESDQARSLENTQNGESNADGLPSGEQASASTQEGQPMETDRQESNADLETKQNTDDSPPPMHDAGADIYLAGDRDMDVDEMDKAYSAYKKKEKRKKKKSKAMGLDDQNSTPAESEGVNTPNTTSLPRGDSRPDNQPQASGAEVESRGAPDTGPEGLLHTSEVTQSLPLPTGGQRGNPEFEQPSWSFDALDSNVEDRPERDPLHGEKQRAFDVYSQRSPSEGKSTAEKAARPSVSRESLRGRRSAEPMHISTNDSSDNWGLDVQKQRALDTSNQTSSGEAAKTPLESTSKNRASYLFQSPQDNTTGVPTTPENRRLRGPPNETNEQEASGFSPVRIGRGASPHDALQAIPEERRVVRTGQDNHGDDAGNQNQRPRSSLNGVSTDTVKSIDAPNPNKPLSTDHLINRLSWPPVDEDSETVNMNRSLRMKPSKRTISDQRSPSAMSSRSNMSAGHQLRSPDELRSFSRASNRSLTPTLRRMDRSTSGDLRAASRRSDTGSAVGVRSSTQTIPPFQPPPTPPLNDEDVIDGSAARAAAMSDVFQGYGDAQGSQASPTRPPSVRKRQSMHITELESKLDQLTAENRALHDARQDSSRSYMDIDQHGEISTLRETVEARDLDLQRKDAEISQIRAMLQPLQQEVVHLTEINGGLTEANRNLVDDTNGRYGTLQQEHASVNEQWQAAQRELETLRHEHGKVTSGMRGAIEQEIASALAEKNAEILRLREELDMATEQIRALQVQIQSSKSSDFLRIRDEDYFDGACQKLCQHVQQWVLRFSKLSDNRICRFSNDIKDEKVEARLDNAILDGSDVDKLLGDRVRRRDVFMSVVMTMVWEYVFTRYLFGMDREQRQKLKALEKILAEVGPPRAVAQWRATTLTLLSKRPDFARQCGMDTEAVAGEIFALLCQLLPPPSNAEQQLFASLQKVIGVAVDLSIEMRTQRSEYIMLPPLQPEYDRNGDLVRKVHFNSSLMNERSGMFGSNQELEKDRAVVKIVLFPLVVKKGDELGEGEEEIVVCPAQVLVHNEGARGKKVVRVMSGAMEIDDPRRSKQSLISSQPGSVAF